MKYLFRREIIRVSFTNYVWILRILIKSQLHYERKRNAAKLNKFVVLNEMNGMLQKNDVVNLIKSLYKTETQKGGEGEEFDKNKWTFNVIISIQLQKSSGGCW